MQKEYIFHVGNMSCTACVALLHEELASHPGISDVAPDLKTHCVTVVGDLGEKNEELAQELNALLSRHFLTLEKEKGKFKFGELALAVILAGSVIALFIVLQKIGLVNLIGAGEVTYGTAFVIGVVASLSSCMAVVGGLLLSLSATFAATGDTIKPQLYFHASRLLSFFLLGGLLGVTGTFLQLGAVGTLVVGLLAGLVMLMLGIRLLDVLPRRGKSSITLPPVFLQKAKDLSTTGHVLSPVLLGLVSFFLPCGFTQSMQVVTLSTGNFLTGALTMFIFSLGTLPMLALISFSAMSGQGKKPSGVFLKTAGLMVIFFAIFTLINSLVGYGLIRPIFSF